jgi:carbon monoxide dehydrogenase subunit G
MSQVSRQREIAADPDAVWQVLAAFDRIAEWAPNADHSCLLSQQNSGIGMTRRIQTGRTTLVETVIAWEPGARLSYTIAGLPQVIRSVTNTWRLEPVARGTKVTLTSEIDAGPRPPQRLIAKAVGRKLGAASDQMLEAIAAHLEPKANR